MNTKKDYRLTPIFLLNYDSSLEGGIVRYTEKEKGKFRSELMQKAKDLFHIELKDPKKGRRFVFPYFLFCFKGGFESITVLFDNVGQDAASL